ncbi:MAG: septation protein SepH [Nocardioidaceae bacterium]
MQDLTLVGLTEDKQRLVLVDDAGDEYSLPADTKLRAALRGESTRKNGQLEISMESALRPRDIQARIRAGETPDAVAAAAQTTVERVMGYATPVLAERAHIADRAQRASVRRKAGEGPAGPARPLADAVAEQLRSRNVNPEHVEWDAWRREDGRWTLVADYRTGEADRHAEFVFDAPGRYVVAEDDEARWLVGEPTQSRAAQPRPDAFDSPGPRRLSTVGFEDAELPLGEDAIGMVTDDPDAGSITAAARADLDRDRTDEERTEDLTRTAAALRGVTDLAAARGDADWMATQASERPAVRVPEQAPEESPEPSPGDAPEHVEQASAGQPEQPEQPEEPEQPARRPVKKSRGRASVPSWDEIMFGGGKRD